MTIKSKMTQQTLKDMEKITGTKLTFGNLLWAIRESGEIPQVEFANTLQISQSHLSDIEHGRKFVSAKTAAKYADLIGAYSREQFIRLALQDLLDRCKLGVEVDITPMAVAN